VTTGELYARARIAFVGEPSARLYTRRDPLRKATKIVAEREVDGRVVRVCGFVGDETLFRDDVRRVERLVRLVLARYRFAVGMILAGQSARESLRAAGRRLEIERVTTTVERVGPATWRLP
jgi:hypothetical protein